MSGPAISCASRSLNRRNIPLTAHRSLLTFRQPSPENALRPLDLAVILAYFAVTIGIGLWAARRQQSVGDYFLGAHSLPAWGVMLSIVATETSALTVISVPGIAARGNLTFLQLPLGYCLGRIAVAAWLLPGYFRGEQETAYVRLERRFGPPVRRLVSATFLVTRFLGEGVRLFAGALPLALMTGWSIPTSIVIMGGLTLFYTLFGGITAVVWADALQLVVYLVGGAAALFIGAQMAGGFPSMLESAAAAGKLRVFDFSLSFTRPYVFLGAIVGGALLSAASHGTDHMIVQRLLATRSLRSAQVALVGSGVIVVLQFALFLLVGPAIWAAQLAPDGVPSDTLFPSFIVNQLPAGLAGLVIAGILAAALGSSISAMASSTTHDLYASWTGRRDPAHLLRVGRLVSLFWGVGIIGAALGFHASAATTTTPSVVLALSIASVTYGALLGTYVLAGRWARAIGRDVVAATAVTVIVMLFVIFATRLSDTTTLVWLAPVGKLAWPWYVPLGTGLCLVTGILASFTHAPPIAPIAEEASAARNH